MFLHIDHGVFPLLYTSGRVLYIWLATSIMVCCPRYVLLPWYPTIATHLHPGIMPISSAFLTVLYPRYACSSWYHTLAMHTSIKKPRPRYVRLSKQYTLAMHFHPGITSFAMHIHNCGKNPVSRHPSIITSIRPRPLRDGKKQP